MSAFTSTGWQAGFLNVLPAVQTHAQIQFRNLPLEQREDLIQECIASACVAYQRLAAQGKLHLACSSSLATYAVRQAPGLSHLDVRRMLGCARTSRAIVLPGCSREASQQNRFHL